MGKQLNFDLHKGTWGGRRLKSGRKRIHSRGVQHQKREFVNSRRPLHVNFKYKILIRNKEFLKILKRALFNSRAKGLRILHYSVQSNHIHFIIEADNNSILESGMRSLTVTIAKGIQKGKIQIERYHLHVLKTIRETRNAIQYVLFNEQKHTGRKLTKVDEYSSLHCLNIKAMARKFKRTLIMNRHRISFFVKDQEKSYLARKAVGDPTASSI